MNARAPFTVFPNASMYIGDMSLQRKPRKLHAMELQTSFKFSASMRTKRGKKDVQMISLPKAP